MKLFFIILLFLPLSLYAEKYIINDEALSGYIEISEKGSDSLMFTISLTNKTMKSIYFPLDIGDNIIYSDRIVVLNIGWDQRHAMDILVRMKELKRDEVLYISYTIEKVYQSGNNNLIVELNYILKEDLYPKSRKEKPIVPTTNLNNYMKKMRWNKWVWPVVR